MATPDDSASRVDAPTGASVVALRRDAVLMVERGLPPFQRLWSFPGGRSEPGEDAEATARRELLEETGLTVGHLAPLGTFRPLPEKSPLVLTVFAARLKDVAPRAGDDALRAELVRFACVLSRPCTPGATGWIARAIAAMATPPLP